VIDKNGYYQGGGMLSPNGKIFYLNIPKNASTYITNLLKLNKWTHCNIFETTAHIEQTIVFLRDPVDRWVSGISTFIALKILGFGYGSDHFVQDYNHLTQRIIFNQITFDDHTESQSIYLQQIKNYPTIYFSLDNIVTKLSLFCSSEIVSNSQIDMNSSEQNYDTKQISNYIKKQLNDFPDLNTKIINHFAEDYNLIKNTRFYGN